MTLPRNIAVRVLAHFLWAAIACMALMGCGERLKPPIAPLAQTEPPSQESWKSTVTFSDSARVRAILWAGHIAVYTGQRFTDLNDSIHVDFFNEQEQHTSTLTARRGRVHDQTQDFEAYDSVVVTSDSGTVLRTDRLFWINAERKIRTDAFVDITSPTERIMGHGMESDQGLKNYKIFRVTGQSVSGK
jgi:LPS export ABC transporter protein LptC